MIRLYGEKRANLVRVFAARLRSISEAEDLIQDLFLKVQALGDLEVEGDGSALLFRMTSNLMLDRLRSRARASARSLSSAAWTIAETAEPSPVSDPRWLAVASATVQSSTAA